MKLKVSLWHDDCADDPCGDDGWTVYSLSRRHGNFKHHDDMGFIEHPEENRLIPGRELQAKLDAGLAFFVSYYEHGLCQWSIQGAGPQCRWDNVDLAGVIVWEQDEADLGPDTVEGRQADAAAFLERYTDWCNGAVYGYTVEALSACPTCHRDEAADVDFDLPSCGGFYGPNVAEMMAEHIREELPDEAFTYEFTDNMGGELSDQLRAALSA